MRCQVENKKREIPYLQATMYYFVYHINMIALYWWEKLTFTTNENKKIQCIKSTCGKSSSSWFSLSDTRNVISKATGYVTFGFSFQILFFPLIGKFECHCLSAIQIFQCFSSHNLKKFWQTTLDWEWLHQRQVMCQQLIDDIKHTWENIVFFNLRCYSFSQGW